MHLELPSSVGRIIIVGAGGFGREVLHWARDAWPDHSAKIAGFLSADADRLAGHGCQLPILSDPVGFLPQPGDGFLLAIGIPGVRRRVAESLLGNGAVFLSLVHPTAIVAPTATIGTGSVICPHAIVSDASTLGRFTLLNFNSSLAHDTTTGDFAVLSPYATLGGGASIGSDVFLGLHASVGPGVCIGAKTKLAANSCALSNVGPESLIHGVPGRVSPLFSPEACVK